jgi:hypothetical protein
MNVYRDPVVEEVRRIREGNAARFNYDIDRIAADARKRQGADGRKVISAPAPSRGRRSRKPA